MEINKDCKLFLRDVYLYDISACHYTIVKNLGLDLSDIDENDKEARNIRIGIMMRDNPKLTPIIRSITESTISEYMLRNDVSKEEVITRQYDGFIVTKKLKDTTSASLPIGFKKMFQNLIISIDRKNYIAFDGNTVDIKGVSNKYDRMNKMLEKVAKLNFLNKTAIFTGLEKIKNEIFKSSDPYLYCMPEGEKFSIMIKKYGQIEIGKSAVKILDLDDVDREWYFNYYIKPFTKSIVAEFV